jgi:hypothetical protein
MVLKPINQYTVEEVGMWLTAQGLGDHASTFIDAGVDGDVLVSLDINDLKNDLFLSGLQAKKVLSNIEFSKGMTTNSSGSHHNGDENNEKTHQLEHKVKKLENDLQSKDEEIAELNRKLARLECNEAARHHQPTPTQQSYPPPQPQPTQTYYSQPAPPPKPQQPPAGARVVGGAARGAAGGAVKGAIGELP